MSRTSTLILLGVLTILTPFSGLPMSIRTLLTVVFGAGIASIGLIIRGEEAWAHLTGTPSAAASATPEESSPAQTEAVPVGVSPI